MALKPLHDVYTIKRIVVSTYQSITGTGVKAVKQLENECNEINGEMIYIHIPFMKTLYPIVISLKIMVILKKEMKLVRETKKRLWEKTIFR